MSFVAKAGCWAWAAVATAAVSVAYAPAGAEDSENLHSKLTRQIQYLAAQKYRPASDETVVRIAAGQSSHVPVRLETGVVNAVVVACDANCDHVEVALFDYQRKPFGRSPEHQDAVALRGNPPVSGIYEAEVTVPGCHAAECEIGLMVLRQDPGAPRAEEGAYRKYENRDLNGGDIATLKNVALAESCETSCKQNPQCRAYSFDKWNRYCFLKSQIGVLRLDPRSITGVREDVPSPAMASGGITMERYRKRGFPGSGYKFATVAQYEACEAACQGEEACVAYTFKKVERVCRLFATAGEYMPEVGSDSGAKVQSP
jgi:hypothetical protein